MKRSFAIIWLLAVLVFVANLLGGWGPKITIATFDAGLGFSSWIARDSLAGPLVFLSTPNGPYASRLMAFKFGASYSILADTIADSLAIEWPRTVFFPQQRRTYSLSTGNARFAILLDQILSADIFLCDFDGTNFTLLPVDIEIPDSMADYTGYLFNYWYLPDETNMIMAQVGPHGWIFGIHFTEDSLIRCEKVKNVPYMPVPYWYTGGFCFYPGLDGGFSLAVSKSYGLDDYIFFNKYNADWETISSDTFQIDSGYRCGREVHLYGTDCLYFIISNMSSDSMWFVKANSVFADTLGYLCADEYFAWPTEIIVNPVSSKPLYAILNVETYAEPKSFIAKFESDTIFFVDSIELFLTNPVLGHNDTVWSLALEDDSILSIIGWIEDSVAIIAEKNELSEYELNITYPNPILYFPVTFSGEFNKEAELIIYDLTGRQIFKSIIYNVIDWGGRDMLGNPVAPGVYLLQINVASGEKCIINKKIIIIGGMK